MMGQRQGQAVADGFLINLRLPFKHKTALTAIGEFCAIAPAKLRHQTRLAMEKQRYGTVASPYAVYADGAPAACLGRDIAWLLPTHGFFNTTDTWRALGRVIDKGAQGKRHGALAGCHGVERELYRFIGDAGASQPGNPGKIR